VVRSRSICKKHKSVWDILSKEIFDFNKSDYINDTIFIVKEMCFVSKRDNTDEVILRLRQFYMQTLEGILSSEEEKLLKSKPDIKQIFEFISDDEERQDMIIHHNDNDLYSKSIMIVDDEIDIITVIKNLLQGNNNNNSFHVYGFTNPFLALENFKLNYKDYVLIISDIKMRLINGFEFIKRVRQIHPTVKVLLMSALDIDNDLFDSCQGLASSVMVDGLMQKPISMRNLNEIVQKTILELKTIQEGLSPVLSSSQMRQSQPKQQ
jgi:CheY-like chemotaxis protein